MNRGQNIVAIFGPPGVGKSTVIATVIERGYMAYDLENKGKTYPERLKAAKLLFKRSNPGQVWFGAADLKVNDFPSGAMTVLLLPPEAVYLSRWRTRDRLRPEKAGQQGDRAYENFRRDISQFKLVIRNSVDPQAVIEKIKQS